VTREVRLLRCFLHAQYRAITLDPEALATEVAAPWKFLLD
jgi:hypothetical protein